MPVQETKELYDGRYSELMKNSCPVVAEGRIASFERYLLKKALSQKVKDFAFDLKLPEPKLSAFSRGRDRDCSLPPAQIRTGAL